MSILQERKINKYVSVRLIEDKFDTFVAMIHVPTEKVMREWAAIVGMEEGAFGAGVRYAKLVYQMKGIHWATDDFDFLYPCENFVNKYMDLVGFGKKSPEEVSALLMEKIMRESA